MTWPSGSVTQPSTHAEAAYQAYYAGGGDYFRSGYYSHGLFLSASTATVAIATGIMVLRPFFVPVRRSFDRIGVNVTAAAGAGGLQRFGIYGDGGGVPGSLILDAGTVASTSTGACEVTISQSLDPGVYWLATVAQVAACTMTAYPGASVTSPWLSGATTPPSASGALRVTGDSGVTGALPSTTSATAVTSNPPAVCLRAA